jgi:hypothetical protein
VNGTMPLGNGDISANARVQDGHADPDWFDQSPPWKPKEIQLEDGRTLVLEYT